MVQLENHRAEEAPQAAAAPDTLSAPSFRHGKVRPIAKRVGIEALSTEEGARQEEAAGKISRIYDVTPTMARVWARRGWEPSPELTQFINADMETQLPDKWQLRNMELAASILAEAVSNGKKIALCCDYDVDGTTSAAILCRFLRSLGADVVYFSPDRRTEGYGLNSRMVNEAKGQGCEVLVTLDYGTKNAKELDLAKGLGMQTVVVDHHHMPEGDAAPCAAFLNPRQPGCNFADGVLCTAGMAWFLAAAVKEQLQAKGQGAIAERAAALDIMPLLQFVALGSVADLVPLTGVNRVLVKEGLRRLEDSDFACIRALKHVASITAGYMRAEDIAFGLGPHINAVGRMMRMGADGKTGGMLMVELLACDDPVDSMKMAEQFHDFNSERKSIQRANRALALRLLQARSKRPDVVVEYHPDLDEGVIGIVCSGLADEFNTAAILLCDANDGKLKGSGRCQIPGVNLAKLLEEVADTLEKHGGHAAAAGLSLKSEQLERFRRAFRKAYLSASSGVDKTPVMLADAEVTVQELKRDGARLVREIQNLQPCGMGNSAPRFLMRRLQVLRVEVLRGDHLKISLRQAQGSSDDPYITAFWWQKTEHPALKEGSFVDVICTPTIDRKAKHDPKTRDVQVELLAAQKQPKRIRRSGGGSAAGDEIISATID